MNQESPSSNNLNEPHYISVDSTLHKHPAVLPDMRLPVLHLRTQGMIPGVSVYRENGPLIVASSFPLDSGLRLYPCYGEVLDIIYGGETAVLVDIVDAPFGGKMGIVFRGASTLPEWMTHVGAFFRARASLAEQDPQRFVIGEFEPLAPVSNSELEDRLRQLGVPTTRIEF